uniref:DUF4218 domain-containing protein n=1 Tax=Chenopodium quinoa TaxID=63459 RepID=A0A803N611_CHEQI
MYFIERFLWRLKSYVRNRGHPEGSIAEGYWLDECLVFLSRYMGDRVKNRLNKYSDNSDAVFNNADSNALIFKNVEKDEYGLPCVNMNKFCSVNDPFVMSSQVHQVSVKHGFNYVMNAVPRDFFDNEGDNVDAKNLYWSEPCDGGLDSLDSLEKSGDEINNLSREDLAPTMMNAKATLDDLDDGIGEQIHDDSDYDDKLWDWMQAEDDDEDPIHNNEEDGDYIPELDLINEENQEEESVTTPKKVVTQGKFRSHKYLPPMMMKKYATITRQQRRDANRRGPTMMHKVHMRPFEKREAVTIGPVTFEKDIPGEFTRFLGTIARDYGSAPLIYKSWCYVPNKEKMREYVLDAMKNYRPPEDGSGIKDAYLVVMVPGEVMDSLRAEVTEIEKSQLNDMRKEIEEEYEKRKAKLEVEHVRKMEEFGKQKVTMVQEVLEKLISKLPPSVVKDFLT